MADRTAEIRITIDADAGEFVAATPHVPELEARASEEHHAVNLLIQRIREYRASCESAGRPVPWVPGPFADPGGDCIVKRLTGLTPPNATQPTPTTESEG